MAEAITESPKTSPQAPRLWLLVRRMARLIGCRTAFPEPRSELQ